MKRQFIQLMIILILFPFGIASALAGELPSCRKALPGEACFNEISIEGLKDSPIASIPQSTLGETIRGDSFFLANSHSVMVLFNRQANTSPAHTTLSQASETQEKKEDYQSPSSRQSRSPLSIPGI